MSDSREKEFPVMRTITMSTDNAPVTIIYPSYVSPEDYQDLEEYVGIWLRGLKRASIAEKEVDAVRKRAESQIAELRAALRSIIPLHHKWVEEDDLSHEEVQERLHQLIGRF